MGDGKVTESWEGKTALVTPPAEHDRHPHFYLSPHRGLILSDRGPFSFPPLTAATHPKAPTVSISLLFSVLFTGPLQPKPGFLWMAGIWGTVGAGPDPFCPWTHLTPGPPYAA